jgi:uncharacterized membrane protein YraQ (UPF0718 family)
LALALAVAALAVALGALLALVPATSARVIGPIKSFALTASLAVVLTHLVPEGFAGLGAVALVVFVVGALLPIGLESATRALWRRRTGGPTLLALEAGYAGLLVHKLGDGIGLAAYAGPVAGGRAQLDVMVALAAHTVPVVAVVQLAFGSERGRGAGLLRSLGIGAAIALGVVAGGVVPAELVARASPWVAALVSGLLLHVVMHDLTASPPESAADRSLDFGGALLGAAVPALGQLGAHEADDVARLAHELGRSFVGLSLLAAPLLLVGVAGAALVQRIGSQAPRARAGSPLADALRGTLAGAARPLFAYRPLPGSRSTFVAAALLAAPALGLESFSLGVGLLGLEFTLMRLASALLVATGAALLLTRLSTDPRASGALALELRAPGAAPASWLGAFDELFARIGPWMVAGLAAAAIFDVLIPAASLDFANRPIVDLLLMTLIALPSWLCAPAATPIAAVLAQKGLSAGALLVGMVVGPAISLATLRWLKQAYGARATAVASLAVVALVWLIAASAGSLQPAPSMLRPPDSFGIAAGALLLLVLVRSIWLSGVRAWLATLAEHGQRCRRTSATGRQTASTATANAACEAPTGNSRKNAQR